MDYHQTKKSPKGILMDPVLTISALKIGYHDRRRRPIPIAGPLNIEAHPGEFICLIGPNGSGKSTLMRTICKVQSKLDGHVKLSNTDIEDIPRKELAKQLSVVLTDPIPQVNLNVKTLISFGRYPHTGWLGNMTSQDLEMIAWAIKSTHLETLADRNLHELSDGELQKAMIARALSQDTKLMLLDEPTAHLDVASRIEIIRLLKNLTRKTGKTIILTTHELDLALKAADKIWMLSAEHSFQHGSPEDLALNGVVNEIFGGDGLTFDLKSGTFDLHEPSEKMISLEGDEVSVFWTKRALERIGLQISTEQIKDRHIKISASGDHRTWKLYYQENELSFNSISTLLSNLNSKD
jgi:iron complex transport system ATP-binding protein